MLESRLKEVERGLVAFTGRRMTSTNVIEIYLKTSAVQVPFQRYQYDKDFIFQHMDSFRVAEKN
jgi:hypothetical protein